jgi:hypothetical protein
MYRLVRVTKTNIGTELNLIDIVMKAMKRGSKPLTLSTGRSIYAI